MSGGSGIQEYPVPTANSSPQGVAVTANGTAWFVESDTDKIGEVTAGGSFTEYPIPSQQYDSGILQGITVGPDGNLWFTTYSYIGRMTPSGAFTFFPITRYNYAYDITPGPDGNVWFTEVGGIVGYVTPAGAVTEFSAGGLSIDPYFITAGPGGLWFTAIGYPNTNYVYEITTGGSLAQYLLPSSFDLGPQSDITAGPDGRVWFDSSANSLTAMSAGGAYTTYTWPLAYPNGYSPQYIRQYGAGALVFANWYDSSIGLMTTSGSVAFTAVPSGNGARGLGVAPDGTIWFSENDGNAIGMLPPGPAQFPPAVPTAQTYGCACGTTVRGAAGRPPGRSGEHRDRRLQRHGHRREAARTGGGVRVHPRLHLAGYRERAAGTGVDRPVPGQPQLRRSGTATFTSGDGQQMLFTENSNGSYTGSARRVRDAGRGIGRVPAGRAGRDAPELQLRRAADVDDRPVGHRPDPGLYRQPAHLDQQRRRPDRHLGLYLRAAHQADHARQRGPSPTPTPAGC